MIKSTAPQGLMSLLEQSKPYEFKPMTQSDWEEIAHHMNKEPRENKGRKPERVISEHDLRMTWEAFEGDAELFKAFLSQYQVLTSLEGLDFIKSKVGEI